MGDDAHTWSLSGTHRPAFSSFSCRRDHRPQWLFRSSTFVYTDGIVMRRIVIRWDKFSALYTTPRAVGDTLRPRTCNVTSSAVYLMRLCYHDGPKTWYAIPHPPQFRTHTLRRNEMEGGLPWYARGLSRAMTDDLHRILPRFSLLQ